MAESASSSVVTQCKTVALAGNPNTGKSTVFNALTGFRQRVGNYPGVTVEKRTGTLRLDDGPLIELVDLPGAYSLAAHGEDEAVVMDVMLGRSSDVPDPDLIVLVLDASRLSRNLFFTTQILELGKPVVIALNMIDVAEADGIRVDCAQLENELGVPVVEIVATKLKGIDGLKERIVSSLGSTGSSFKIDLPSSLQAELEELIEALSASGADSDRKAHRAEALQTLLDPGGIHEQRLVARLGSDFATKLSTCRDRLEKAGTSITQVEADTRYACINRLVERVTRRTGPPKRSLSDKIDRIVTHRLLGMVILIVTMTACFQAVYSWAGPLVDLIDQTVQAAGQFAVSGLSQGALRSLIQDGVVAGVGAVLVFLPQILILFLFLAILEDCGYMARAALLLDRWMGFVGLNGQSFIPLLSSFACAVPGIMAARTIHSRRDRFLTILIAPLMSCSARLPVYVLLIGAFIPATPLLGGVVTLQATVLLAMYLVGIVVAIGVALLLKKTLLKGEAQAFLMEFPSYKIPSARNVFHRVFEQGKAFCVSAGTIIFAVTIVVWALGYYPRPVAIAQSHDQQLQSANDQHAQQIDSATKAFGLPTTPEAARIDEAVSRVIANLVESSQGFEDRVVEENLADGSKAWQDSRDVRDKAMEEIVAQGGVSGIVGWEIFEADRILTEEQSTIERSRAGAYLRHSYLGRMGRWIEPAVRPLGWDWRIGTAVIASFPAREIVVATMATIYNLGGGEDETSASMREKLRSATWPDGRKVFDIPVALSIMVFFALCCQCAATLAAIRRETNSWRWPLLTFSYMTVLAYGGAWITYVVAGWLT